MSETRISLNPDNVVIDVRLSAEVDGYEARLFAKREGVVVASSGRDVPAALIALGQELQRRRRPSANTSTDQDGT